MKNSELPTYVDGVLNLMRIVNAGGDYPGEYLHDEKMSICFREIAIYDKRRIEMESVGKEITHKIVIPRYQKIDTRCVCVINGEQNEVYNVAHITNKNGFPETEITLIKPKRKREMEVE